MAGRGGITAAMILRRMWLPVFLISAISACRTGRDYEAKDSPRYAGVPDDATIRTCPLPCEIRIVSFNIAFARRIPEAIELLKTDSALQHADIVLLQEMDAEGAKRIAKSLGMWYVYYPAIYHRRSRHDFGNAVLAKFPIVEDAKVVLPQPSRYAGTHRIATAATVGVGQLRVRVYSTHLGTIADISGGRRRDQMRAILSDASKYPHVIIGGDMNDSKVGSVAEEARYAWPTKRGPRTTRFGRWDHVLVKGLESSAEKSGTVVKSRGVSDHHPVWATVILAD